jgi:APA family basic amino acid/polyamine antiporter
MTQSPSPNEEKFVRGLGLVDSTMLVAGSMIGSGIFIVSSIIGRQAGAPGWLLVVWLVTGLLTLMAALSYGELAAMMPKAGGQYVYLREAFSPLWGFLYGWTLFLVIQTGTIAAVAVGFARYMGVLLPWVSESKYFIEPIRFGSYAFSLSTAQFVGLAMIALLTFMNTRGLKLGKLVQNVFTTAKTGALIALILLCIVVGRVRAQRTSATSGESAATCRKSAKVLLPSRPLDCSLASASRKPTRFSRPTRGTTSLSPPAK